MASAPQGGREGSRTMISAGEAEKHFLPELLKRCFFLFQSKPERVPFFNFWRYGQQVPAFKEPFLPEA